eukprot:503115-Alexandrium_andersonii.AAC.1
MLEDAPAHFSEARTGASLPPVPEEAAILHDLLQDAPANPGETRRRSPPTPPSLPTPTDDVSWSSTSLPPAYSSDAAAAGLPAGTALGPVRLRVRYFENKPYGTGQRETCEAWSTAAGLRQTEAEAARTAEAEAVAHPALASEASARPTPRGQ